MKLTDRISHIEAELSIRNLIAKYGLAVDCGDIETAINCHTKNATYRIANPNAGRGVKNSRLRASWAIQKLLKC